VELGGQLTVERASSGGTLVRTILPLPTMEGAV
jgi:signal transduction histidine kinase